MPTAPHGGCIFWAPPGAVCCLLDCFSPAILVARHRPGRGYGFAWFSHLVFEKNRPATFRQPLYSFMGDWVMFWQILTGKIAF